ncbi:protein GrpE [Virgibacillus pantothenticus]|uniref:Protein GrpE n=1 Tax=Virgibacillus pantothenticus TaxID=1473 RepID=A0A0L0QPP9_VIRPA|nr:MULTISPECIES: nucleotide exchange factor GrpE [Virgibacillus]API90584.1 nucleotide exchange factor GrpE [Virgibacillus sp. 6R]KNE20539.1 protein GrpE [Virgibacillus pantothenticus]MBS7429699.1 nucleotide exchange factor GrpE [Virgibacillus sp. 19R1-5]MBU8565574.1 nucleotide exchange factor GrpE [Virgibacillus pantothenticus]MBU8599872.1 nucleotide exchange factor GrpE [Virgibacillus pantothenticus]
MEEQEKQTNTTTEEENNVNEEVVEDETAESVEVLDKEETEEANDSEEDTSQLQSKLNALQAEKDELYQQLLRVQAEYDNFKKRTIKEREAARKYQSQDLIQELLPALDNFERALQVEKTEATASIIDGISMVYNQLKEALASQGAEEIPAVGEEFDPNIHHAVMQVEDDDQPSNTVVEELQKGYKLKDRVIRPAMVKVTK